MLIFLLTHLTEQSITQFILSDNLERLSLAESSKYKPATKFNAPILLLVNIFAFKIWEKVFYTSINVVT